MTFLLMPNENFWYNQNNVLPESWDIINKILIAKREMWKTLEENLPSPETQKKISDFISNFTIKTIFLPDIQDLNKKEEMKQLLKVLPVLLTQLDNKTTQKISNLLQSYLMKNH